MNFLSNFQPRLLLLFFILLFSCQVIPRIWSDSLTTDEPSDIANGYYYLTHGDVVTGYDQPPLAGALTTLPLLLMDLKAPPSQGELIDRGHRFIFDWNRESLSPITLAARLMSWLFGCGIGLLLFGVTRKNPTFCGLTLAFWALDPTLGALSGLAKTDIVPSFMFFLSVLIFQKSLEKPSPKISFAAGAVLAMAVTAKFYGLILIPAFLLMELIPRLEGFRFHPWSPGEKKNLLTRWVWIFAGLVIWVSLLYLPASILLSDHRMPFAYFAEQLKNLVLYEHRAHSVFFMGECGLQSHWIYFPAAFILKEPTTFLIFLTVGFGLALRGKLSWPPWRWVPALFLFLAILPATNLGVRYLLPLYPFLFLIAGEGAAWFWEKRDSVFRGAGKVFVAGMVLGQGCFVLSGSPHALSFFNEWVPSDKKIHFLADSNLDWGQDLKRLAATGKERGWGKVRLAYYGGVDPQVYGLDWEPWRESDLGGGQPGQVYAVNASFFQLSPAAYPPTRTIADGWISQRIPTGKVADSWYYFEIPGKIQGGTADPYLVSAPFIQYRGYRVFTPGALSPVLAR